MCALTRLLLVLAIVAIPARMAAASPPDSASSVTLEVPPSARLGPDFSVDRATEAYLALISAEDRARSQAYANGGYFVSLFGFIYGIGIAWMLLASGLSVRMRNIAERWVRWKAVQALLYGGQYILLTTILAFPWTVYETFVREHRFGLATQNFGPWLGDQATGLGVGLVFGAPAISLIYVAIRRWPKRWWIGATVASWSIMVVAIAIAPVYIDPLFNDYEPLEDGPVRDAILAMAKKYDVPAKDVYRFDASRQSTRISANVSGLLGTMRISLNDNLLNRTSPEEIEAVMGHELGHYVLNHVWFMTFGMGTLIAIGFFFIHRVFELLRARWEPASSIRDISDVAGLPLVAALLSVYFFVLTPVTYGIVRYQETAADRFGLEAAQQPDGFARVAVRLAEYRKLDPNPWEEWLLFHHPSGRTRVRTAMQWKAEHSDAGNQPKQ